MGPFVRAHLQYGEIGLMAEREATIATVDLEAAAALVRRRLAGCRVWVRLTPEVESITSGRPTGFASAQPRDIVLEVSDVAARDARDALGEAAALLRVPVAVVIDDELED